jgi:phage terminase small subunit
MRQRGKISEARLAVVAPVTELHAAPASPDHLPADQAAVWRSLVEQMPANWFQPETHAMLETLCAVTVQLGQVNREMAKFGSTLPKSPAKWNRYRDLTRLRGQLTNQIATLQTKLRMTPQSRIDPVKAGRRMAREAEQPAVKPWEDQ